MLRLVVLAWAGPVPAASTLLATRDSAPSLRPETSTVRLQTPPETVVAPVAVAEALSVTVTETP